MPITPTDHAPNASATLWISGPLPGQNELVAAAKGFGGRGYGYSKIKRQWKDAVCLLARAAHLPRYERAHVAFEWVEPNRRRDPDNVSGGGRKLILDGLVAAGVLPGDGWANVAGFAEAWRVDAQRPGVIVTISDASPAPKSGPTKRRATL